MELQTLQELNRDFAAEGRSVTRQSLPAKSKKNQFTRLADSLFYFAVAIILMYAFVSDIDSGAPKNIFGYSWFTVVSRSMQDEIPKGSLILVKKTDALAVGDNITFMRDSVTTVTHKIVSIYEDYYRSGSSGYQTKGLSNASPDDTIVSDANIVGKVVLVVPGAGMYMSWLGANIHIVLLIYGLCVVFSFLARGLLYKY